MSRAIGRRHLATMALIATVVTACSGEHEEDTSATKTSTGRESKQNPSVLSQQQLEDAVVDAHDLPGVRVEEMGAGTEGVGNGVIRATRRTDTDPSLCAPVSAALEGASGYTPVGSVQRIGGTKGRSAIFTLVSYHPADASRVIDELRTALKSCKRYTAGPMKDAYEGVEAIDAPPQGDDGIAFRLTLIMEPGEDGLKVPTSVAVLRHGSTLAIYKVISDDFRTPASIPSDLVTAQSKALDTAVYATP